MVFKNMRSNFILFFIIFLCGNVHAQKELETLFLSWREDPTSTMSINWHTVESMSNDSIYYRMKGDSVWISRPSEKKHFPFSERLVYNVNLSHLNADAQYEFKVGPLKEIYWFETMPTEIQDKSVVFAIGGDTYDRDLNAPRHMWMERMNRAALEYNPDFIVWGGDLAYADGREDQIWRWYGWFEAVRNSLIRPDGKIVPIIVAIGNHEVNTSYYEWGADYEDSDVQRTRSAPYFYSLFDFPGQPGYNVLDFSDYLSLIILDSDHTNPISGKQTQWLAKVLSERTEVDHVFPVYHVPAYPSTKSDMNQRSTKRVREYWSSLFDQYNLPYAFEHHDHAYKRTFPIRNEQIDPDGVIYLGDGGWGTKVREVKHVDTTWYLEKTERVRYALMVSLYRDQTHLLAIDEYGNTVDEYPVIFERPHEQIQTNAVMLPDGGVSISAEFAQRAGTVYFDSYYPGFTAGGYGWFETKEEPASLKWTVPVQESGKYLVRLRYSNMINRISSSMYINGETHPVNLSFDNTSTRYEWAETDFIQVNLMKGLNELRFECANVTEFFVDCIEVVPMR